MISWTFKFRFSYFSLICLVLLIGCDPIGPNFAQRSAQPKVPAARNFTSFSASLRCMDTLLGQSKQPRRLISSTGIPDLTKRISVGGDDMLVNAIGQMNRSNQTYVFVDQSLEKDSGQLEIFTPIKNGVKPSLYIRGSISQLDSNVATIGLTSSGENVATPSTSVIGDGRLTVNRGISVVSVDMHLVSFPNKIVIPGSSVANSMIVSARSFGSGASGLIDMTGLNTTLQITRVESLGQAVRNLVELGAIELIGRHAKVPYWDCLNVDSVNQRKNNRKEIMFHSGEWATRIPDIQRMLTQLGYLTENNSGNFDSDTRKALSKFQANTGLIATGQINYDTFQRLLEKTEGFKTTAKVKNAKRASAPTQIKLLSQAEQYNLGDKVVVEIEVPLDGYLSCYHQTNSGPVTQILPIEPNSLIKVRSGDSITVPSKNSDFDIKFEDAQKSERFLCALQNTQNNSGMKNIAASGPLKPMKTSSFNSLRNSFKNQNRSIIFGELQVAASN